MIENERMAVYIQSLDPPLPDYLADMEKQARENHVPVIRKSTQSLLRFLLRLHRPQQILEVGTAVGFSALLMKEYLPEGGQITTIERIPKRIEEACANLKRFDPERCIRLLTGDAADVLNELAVQEASRYDMVFMDAAKAQYIHFLPPVLKLMKPGALLVSDNVLQDGTVIESRYSITRRDRTIHSRMREYLSALTHSEALETVILPVGDGITMSTKVK
ncbi:O-methyltransferase [Anaerolentibacter hominis]|uniref:O-methyltransferase n=1 Tax=Anaerolentibacter hominis TaxID=3079009 RepID=UPI0031B8318A